MPNQNYSRLYDAVTAASITAKGQEYVRLLNEALLISDHLKEQLDDIDKLLDNAAMTTENLITTHEELKSKVLEALHSGEVLIEFEKADGSIRKLRGTLDLDNLISEEYHPKNEVERKKSPDVQNVFDLDKKEWRSFRWDKLRAFNGARLDVILGNNDIDY